MSRPYSYDVSFISGMMGATESVIVPYFKVQARGHDLVLHQHSSWPEGDEGARSREQLHRLVDAWLDGVEFEG